MECHNKEKNTNDVLTKENFLRVLDHAIKRIKPPCQETQRMADLLLVVKGYLPNIL